MARLISSYVSEGPWVLCKEVGLRKFCCCLYQSVSSFVSGNANIVLAPTGALPSSFWTGCLGCDVAAGWEGQLVQPWETKEQTGSQFFFFRVSFDDRAISSGQWQLGSPLSTVVWQLAHRAWCPLQCPLARTVGVLSPGVGRSEECAQEFAPQSHIHSGLNQQDLISSDVFLAHGDQYPDGRWWFGSSCQGVNLVFLWVVSIMFQSPGWFLLVFHKGLDSLVWGGEVDLNTFCCCLYQSVCSLVCSLISMESMSMTVFYWPQSFFLIRYSVASFRAWSSPL